MDKIKLVIWDLDDTFWNGTISEGEIEPIQSNIDLVRHLTQRGIMNSIVSKNDFEVVKTKLKELEIWDYFIFPIVSWNPKGESVKRVIEKFQFRNVNVLFLDDNHMNLEEVKYYNPGIHVMSQHFIPEILNHESFKGKDDSKLERLADYKLLEEKDKFRETFTSNLDFLRQSNITLSFEYNLADKIDRVVEMIERTNQLNFTKKRIGYDETMVLLTNPNYSSFIIRAKDKYGDYGIIGFVSLDKLNNNLEHFLFSCRIMNLGIEDFVFNMLGQPKLIVNGDVVSNLGMFQNIDWIKVIENHSQESKASSEISILFKGGCDLSAVFHYLSNYNINLINETNYVLSSNFPVHNEHSEIVLNFSSFNSDIRELIENKLPFFDQGSFKTQMFSVKNSVIIFSVLMDYTQDIYRHKKLGFKIPFGGYGYDLTNAELHDLIAENYRKKGLGKIDKEFLTWFGLNFENEGQISPSDFILNLSNIYNKIDRSNQFVIINGSEVFHENMKEKDSYLRHKEMNDALDLWLVENKSVRLIDVRNIVNSRDKLEDNIRHYKREVYPLLAKEMITVIENSLSIKIKQNYFHKARLAFYKFRKRLFAK